ncbi:UNVERIFIED_CONTAM: hypothetical protein HDU68_007959 [Siphonaria sp. JEL0065]|nr:hypothetical protein HDU68_007959 [Siphonaria sp. JEL0065]
MEDKNVITDLGREPLLPTEVWIHIILFAEDVDLETLSRTSKFIRRLVFDKIVRRKIQERCRERVHSFLLTPQRRSRIQLAEINILKGSPGIQRRLIEGDYIGSATAATNYSAYADLKKEFVMKRLTRALERRPSSENVLSLMGVNLTNSSALIPKVRQLQRAMTSDVLRRKLRRELSAPAEII